MNVIMDGEESGISMMQLRELIFTPEFLQP
jgi:hypothetical protein